MTHDRTLLQIPRDVVESEETEFIAKSLNFMVTSPKIAPAARGNVVVAFDGYEEDSRELWQIPEVRRFVRLLDADFPFWFVIADLSSDTLRVVAACLCQVHEAQLGFIRLDRNDMERFLTRGFGAMNQVWDDHGWSTEENESRSDQIIRYLSGVPLG